MPMRPFYLVLATSENIVFVDQNGVKDDPVILIHLGSTEPLTNET